MDRVSYKERSGIGRGEGFGRYVSRAGGGLEAGEGMGVTERLHRTCSAKKDLVDFQCLLAARGGAFLSGKL